MKNLTVLLMVLMGHIALAQTGPAIRLHAYTTYAFDDKVDSYYSSTAYFNGKVKGGLVWGAGLEYKVMPNYGIELGYLRLDSKAPMTYYLDGVRNTNFDLISNYVMLSGNRYFGNSALVEPYAGLQGGMVIFNASNPDNGNSGSTTKFAWGFRAGANIWATPRVGVKIQAGVLSVVQAVGGGLYFGTGGSGANLSGYSTFFQFNIGGGLAFKLSGE